MVLVRGWGGGVRVSSANGFISDCSSSIKNAFLCVVAHLTNEKVMHCVSDEKGIIIFKYLIDYDFGL